MKTKQKLPETIRGMVKYDLKHYLDYVNEINSTEDYESPRYKHIKIVVDAIDKVFKELPYPERSIILTVNLNQIYSVEAAADLHKISKSSAYTMISHAMLLFAIEMGYVKPKQKGVQENGI